MNTTYELNNLRKDSDIPGRINKQSPIVEVFSAMVNGEELSKFGAKADKAVSYKSEIVLQRHRSVMLYHSGVF